MKTRSQTLVHHTKKASLSPTEPSHSNKKSKIRSEKLAMRLRSEGIKSKKQTPPEKSVLRPTALLQRSKKEKKLETKQQATKLNGKSNDKKTIAEFNSEFDVFVVGDIVWGKMKGHPHWPGKITKIVSFSPFKIELVFFEDGRRANLFEKQLKHLIPGFKSKEIATKIRNNEKVRIATKTAMINYFFQQDMHHRI